MSALSTARGTDVPLVNTPWAVTVTSSMVSPSQAGSPTSKLTDVSCAETAPVGHCMRAGAGGCTGCSAAGLAGGVKAGSGSGEGVACGVFSFAGRVNLGDAVLVGVAITGVRVVLLDGIVELAFSPPGPVIHSVTIAAAITAITTVAATASQTRFLDVSPEFMAAVYVPCADTRRTASRVSAPPLVHRCTTNGVP